MKKQFFCFVGCYLATDGELKFLFVLCRASLKYIIKIEITIRIQTNHFGCVVLTGNSSSMDKELMTLVTRIRNRKLKKKDSSKNRWTLPEDGYVKINVDAFRSHRKRSSTLACIMRDS